MLYRGLLKFRTTTPLRIKSVSSKMITYLKAPRVPKSENKKCPPLALA